MFTFANQAGLDMLETTLVALQDIMLDKTLDDSGRKALCSEFAKIMQQVFSCFLATLDKFCESFFPIERTLSFGWNHRAMLIFLRDYVCRVWEDQFRMSKRRCGRFLTTTNRITAWRLFSLTGPSCEEWIINYNYVRY